MFLIKKYPKDVFVTAHYEWVETEEGAVEKRIMVKGKEWKSMIEKEFTIVQYADMKIVNEKREYIIHLNSDGKTSAKTPPMFLEEDENDMTNNYSPFLEKMRRILNDN